MQLRKSNQIHVAELKEELLNLASENGTENADKLAKEQLMDFVELSLEELNHEQKTCITLYYLKKQSYSQIAESTGFSGDQVKSYIQNGKRT